MDKLDLAVIESAKKLAELRPEKYGVTYDIEFRTHYLATGDLNIVSWEDSVWVLDNFNDHLDQMLADEGMAYSISNWHGIGAWYWYLGSNYEPMDLAQVDYTEIKDVKEIHALKQKMLKEIFCKFVELLESK